MLTFCWVAGMGCTGKDNVPRGIIPRDRMEQVMWDMAQADQFVALYVAKDSARTNLKKETLKLYETVFRLHGVSVDEFRKSYRYYLDHPELGQLLFDSVITRGTRARMEMYDRPSPFHPPVPAIPGARISGKTLPAGTGSNAMERLRELARKRQDSIARVMHLRRDTIRGKP